MPDLNLDAVFPTASVASGTISIPVSDLNITVADGSTDARLVMRSLFEKYASVVTALDQANRPENARITQSRSPNGFDGDNVRITESYNATFTLQQDASSASLVPEA